MIFWAYIIIKQTNNQGNLDYEDICVYQRVCFGLKNLGGDF